MWKLWAPFLTLVVDILSLVRSAFKQHWVYLIKQVLYGLSCLAIKLLKYTGHMWLKRMQENKTTMCFSVSAEIPTSCKLFVVTWQTSLPWNSLQSVEISALTQNHMVVSYNLQWHSSLVCKKMTPWCLTSYTRWFIVILSFI